MWTFMSRRQSAGQNRIAKTDNGLFKNVAKLKHLRTTVTNQNDVKENIKSTFNSGKGCYHSVQHRLFFCLLFKHVKIKISKIISLCIVLHIMKLGISQ